MNHSCDGNSPKRWLRRKKRSRRAAPRSMCILSTKQSSMAILGISTNTRLLGKAIIRHGKLVEYSMHFYKLPWSPAKADAIITSLEPCIKQFCIKNIVLSIPHSHHQTPEFQALLGCIRRHFIAKGIAVSTLWPTALHSLLPEKTKRPKKLLMLALCKRFPELDYYHRKELKNRRRHYIKLFEAVAAALVQSKNG
jgi:hypothetical protein